MKSELIKAEQEFELGNFERSNEIATGIINENSLNTDALLLRAKINYTWQKWGEALNDLNRILELDAENQMAKNYRQMVMNILVFWNKDSYNP